MNKSTPKIDIVSGMFMLIMAVTADIAEILATLSLGIPVIGQILPIFAWFYGLSISAILLFWLYNINVSVRWFLSGSGIDLIPILNALPVRTAALLATFMEDRSALAKMAIKKVESRK